MPSSIPVPFQFHITSIHKDVLIKTDRLTKRLTDMGGPQILHQTIIFGFIICTGAAQSVKGKVLVISFLQDLGRVHTT